MLVSAYEALLQNVPCTLHESHVCFAAPDFVLCSLLSVDGRIVMADNSASFRT